MIKKVKISQCQYCGGFGQNLDSHEDFCPECGAPSPDYRRLVEAETLEQLNQLDLG